MDTLIKNIYSRDLTGVDVQYLTNGKSKVLLYDDITVNDNILDLIGETNQTLLLFPTQRGSIDGHWISITYQPKINTIFYFDSYGLSIEGELKYSTSRHVQRNALGTIIGNAVRSGVNFVWNPIRLQVMENGINTCGRFAAMRNRFAYLTNDEFVSLFINQKESPDYLLTIITFLSISAENKDEQKLVMAVVK